MADQQQIRVLLADAHTLAREGYAALVGMQPDMVVVGQAADGEEAVDLFRRLRPDVLLLDMRMPKLDGVAVLMAVRAAEPKARVLVLTTSDGDQDITRALRAGAKGYLLTNTPRDEFLDAVRAVYAGGKVVPPGVAVKVAQYVMSQTLTPREVDVLELLTSGKPNKQIAFDLGVSEGTVKTHVNSILQKLGCGSRTEAVAVAVRRGFLRL